ncbi:hypothetical protein QM312_37305, partial [Burkholderia cenocepacia]|nr:hypothetical protein [Burkholderia cenocepacia]
SAESASLLGAEIGLALTGLGMGIATGPLMTVAVGAVDAARSGTASALVNVAPVIRATLTSALAVPERAASTAPTATVISGPVAIPIPSPVNASPISAPSRLADSAD